MKSFFIFVLFTLVFSTQAWANKTLSHDEEMQHLLNLEVDQLISLNIKVSVASKREENINEAPGIITVVTAEEISRYGYRNLRDILDRQTHMQVIGSNLFPHNRVSVRGVSFTHTDNVVLPLINGRPVREATSANTDHDFYASFPVEAIEKIEIIRGPGSVLYGTNAFAGTINIITRQAPDKPGGSVSATYGSFDSKKGTLSGGGRWGEFEFFGALNAFDIDGDDFENITDELGTVGTYKTGIDGGNLVLNAKYKGFTLNTMLSDTSRDHGRSTFVLPSTENDVERQFVDLGYQHQITDDWDISANFSYHHFRDEFFIGAGTVTQLGDADNYLAEISTHANITEKLSVLAGGTYNHQDGRIKLGDLNYDIYSLGAYLQFDYWLFNWLKLIGGIQYNKPESVPADISPRVAAIAQINKQWGIKILYGNAFRESSPVERFIVAPSVIGNPQLEPEKIDTFDLQIFYNGIRGSFAATYFHSEHNDLVTRTGALPQTLINSGEVIYDGFELEGNLNLVHGFSFTGNLSYQTNDKDDGTEEVTFAPDWMIKTGLFYKPGNGAMLGIFNSFFAASTLQNSDITPGVANVNPDAESYNLLTANITLNLGKLLNDSSFTPVILSLYGDNLLDEEIFFPSINRRTVNSLPHHEGRGFFGTVQIEF